LKAGGYTGHKLGVFIVRILFLLFGDSTGLWPRQAFGDFVRNRTNEDGSDLGIWLSHLFSVLDTIEPDRSNVLDEDLAAFPYVNGGLFAGHYEAPDTTRSMRDGLLSAATFDWSAISPAIFGSIFQEVMHDDRDAIGAHYTSEKNIMRVIEPLFLDELKTDLEECGSSPIKLRNFHERLASLTFFDPACGCGNFLVIAYRELRALETKALLRQSTKRGKLVVQRAFDLESRRKVSLSQFYGIEILEFPCRIAETAMYLMDHLANEDLSAAFGHNIVDLPLQAQIKVVTENALDMDWNDVIPSDQVSFVYGNPPFLGKKGRSEAQQADMVRVFGGERGTGELDYVTAWYEKMRTYVTLSTTRIAFVSTSSIVQGEQVSVLWPRLLDKDFEIGFAHRPFSWSSEARAAAVVAVVIVGMARTGAWKRKRIFEYPDPRGEPLETEVKNINAYLADYGNVYVRSRRTPLYDVPPARFGSMPNDHGSLILTSDEAAEIRATDPIAAKYIAPMVSTRQMLHGEERFCLWLEASTPADRKSSPELVKRIKAVRAHRLASTRAATRQLAEVPYLFAERRQPNSDYLCIPRHASENRRLLPMAFYPKIAIASDSTVSIEEADAYLFGVLQSSMFSLWLETVGGRLEDRLRFSIEVVYNTFPFPDPSTSRRAAVAAAAKAVLAARSAQGSTPLADLYDPDV
ncbi:MAG: DNA methyltransferase, partial [Candidatus Acidiferrum sp.]